MKEHEFRDYVKAGKFKAELQQAFREIDAKARETIETQTKTAFAAFMNGDYEGRDDACHRGIMTPQLAKLAKQEAAIRILQGHGMGFQEAQALVRDALKNEPA